MIHPAKSVVVASRGLTLADFESDVPWPHAAAKTEAVAEEGTIHDVTVSSLIPHSDARGSLCELLTTRDGRIEPIVHVYQVTALPGSIRAWVYHRRQYDRLAFANGHFRIVLYDIRSNSPTFVNMPTKAYDLDDPDKCRLPERDPRIPFSFDIGEIS